MFAKGEVKDKALPTTTSCLSNPFHYNWPSPIPQELLLKYDLWIDAKIFEGDELVFCLDLDVLCIVQTF